MNFEFNFGLVIAHTILLESKGIEPLGATWAVNGGDNAAPSTQESMDQILRAYSSNLPNMVRAQTEAAQQYEPAMLALRGQVSPGQNQLDLDLLNRFGGQFAAANQRIAGDTAMSRAGDDLRLINGPGRDLARSAMAMQRESDPEAYRARELAVGQLGRLNDSLINPDAGMSESQRMEMDRSLARDNFSRGTGANPTATSTVSNAMQFGQAGEALRNNRQSAIAEAAKISAGAVQPLSSGIDTFQLTTGRPSAIGPNGSGSREVGADTNALGSGLLNNTTNVRQQENQINSQRRDALDRVSQVMSSLPSVSCCWTFAEAYYGWDNIPDEVRISRDMHYTLQRREGYRMMSKWLVPRMRSSRTLRFVTMLCLVWPMTCHAKWYVNNKGIGWIFTPLQQLYLAIWEYYGKRAGMPAEVYNLHLADGPWNSGIFPPTHS
ncbi:MAG: hypothetical protein EBR82_66060 [Caulobacteraceae bacterium]|nr:hypothetical protein [Caulobacteraceae bacterium]